MKHIKSRRGFTLVELMVVIAIILVILALSFALVQRTIWAMEDAKASREVKLLDQACEQFKVTFGKYPPGRIMLCEDMRGYRAAISDHLCQGYYQEDPIHARALELLAMMSMEYLQSIFPGIDLNAGHDWNGDGRIDDRQYYLSGQETMVLFLGGMRYGKGAVDAAGSNRTNAQGWNTDKCNPTRPSNSTRLGPFFEFDPARIVYPVCSGIPSLGYIPSPGGGPAGDPTWYHWCIGCSSGLLRRPDETHLGFFATYSDVWNTRYSYFYARHPYTDNYTYYYCPYSYKFGLVTTYNHNYQLWFADNFYKPDAGILEPPPINEPKLGGRYNEDDNTYSSMWIDFVPYIEDSTANQVKYHNAKRFQIISAGRDKTFGTGGYFINDHQQAETSRFTNYRYFQVENIPGTHELKANHDNITNINFTRVVPRP